MSLMGWWQIEGARAGFVWGDELADILDDALEQIHAAYRREWGRPISHTELVAGFNFSTGAPDEIGECCASCDGSRCSEHCCDGFYDPKPASKYQVQP